VPDKVLEKCSEMPSSGKKESSAVFEVAALRGTDALAQGGQSRRSTSPGVRALERLGLGDFVSIDLTSCEVSPTYTGHRVGAIRCQQVVAAAIAGEGATKPPSIFRPGVRLGGRCTGELLKERGAVSKASSELGAF